MAVLSIGLDLMVIPSSFMVFRSTKWRNIREAAGYIDQEKAKQAGYFYSRACMASRKREMDSCLRDLKKAIDLDPSCAGKASEDEALEWARNDPRVRKVLGLATGAKPRD